MRKYLFALLLVAQCAYSADPVVSSASVSGNTLTVSGSNFGSNSSPTPHRLLTWQGLTNGAAADSQFDAIEKVNYATSTFIVDNSDGVGGGSLRMDFNIVGVGEVFPHHEFSLPGVDYIFVSHFVKAIKTSSNPTGPLAQMKFYRAGVADGGTPVTNYQSDWLQAANLFTGGDDGSSWSKVYYYRDGVEPPDGQYSGDFTATPFPAIFGDGQWHFLEMEMQMNTPNVADGFIKLWVDGVLYNNLATNPRTLSTQHFDYVQPMPGLSLDFEDNNWIIRESRHLVSLTKARIFLGNASTHSAVTKKYFLSSSSWNGADITSDVTGRPVGYDWVYVVNSNGEVNATGFAFSESGTDITASMNLTEAANDSFTASGNVAIAASSLLSITPVDGFSAVGAVGITASMSIIEAANDSFSAVQSGANATVFRARRRGFRNGFGF